MIYGTVLYFGFLSYSRISHDIFCISVGARCHPEVPACRHHGAHGHGRQHQHSQGHRNQVWHHPTGRGLPLHRRQGVQQEDPQRERRGDYCLGVSCGVRLERSQRARKEWGWRMRMEEVSLKRTITTSPSVFVACVCTCVLRWNRSVWTRFGLSSECLPGPPQLTNTHSSKVNCWLNHLTCLDLVLHYTHTGVIFRVLQKAVNNWYCSSQIDHMLLKRVYCVYVCVWQASSTAPW